MKLTQFITVGVIATLLPSCGLLQSAVRLPTGLLKSAVRTTGLNVAHEEPEKTALQKKEEGEAKIY